MGDRDSVLETALHWRSLGVSTIPVEPMSKRPAIPWRRWQRELPPVWLLRRWFAQDGVNLAVITGGASNLLVLDFDVIGHPAVLRAVYPALADGYLVRSGRGLHVYLFCRKPTSSMLSYVPGLDVRANGACCNAPPSTHPNGQRYEVLHDGPILEVESLSDVLPIALNSVKEKERPCAEALASGGSRREPVFLFTESSAPRRQDLIGRIRQAMPIVNLLARYTRPIPSSTDGRWWVMRCPSPNHQDENPSFWADNQRGICGCYVPHCQATQPGGRPMDIFNVYSWLHGCSNREAIRRLAQEVGLI